MDGATQPVILVIGHPIAGNPSQFAIERALKSVQLDWRVLSCDVSPEHLGAALSGADALGFTGVFIDPTLSTAAKAWLEANLSEGSDTIQVDCLCRSDDGQSLVACGFQSAWLGETIAGHEERLGRPIEKRIWLGEFEEGLPLSADGFTPNQPTPLPPDPDIITDADLVVIAHHEDGIIPLEVEEWPENDGSVLVIDLTDGHPDLPHIRRAGFTVVSNEERQIATLQRCLRQWTQLEPSTEIIHDAIEEYLAV